MTRFNNNTNFGWDYPAGVTSQMIDDHFGDDSVSACCGAEYEEQEIDGDELVDICCECGDFCKVVSQSDYDQDEYERDCDFKNDEARDNREE